MSMKSILFIGFLIWSCNGEEYAFPKNFRFGVATASYQVEGAWKADNKGENIWDRYTHSSPRAIKDRSNGDVACDTYHKNSGDVTLLKNMDVNFYRFSLSWSRLFPTGHINFPNQLGINYYNNLINGLLAKNITPMVTIYHWDLPQSLQELGGWPNRVLADYYVDFADEVFRLFGDRVKEWITFNEPLQFCMFGYSQGKMAPGYAQDGIGGYLCGHTVLLAHARAYRIYEHKYKKNQKGRVGITVHSPWNEPESSSTEDKEASENSIQFQFGWFMHPIFSRTGDYPAIMKTRIDFLSQDMGFPRSRLPVFTPEEIKSLKGSADFMGLNHYTTFICKPLNETDANMTATGASHDIDIGASCYQSSAWESAASVWLKVVPWGFRNILNWIKAEYNNPEVIVTENGFSDSSGTLSDCRRVHYINAYLEELLKAIVEDNCTVTAYTAWSFMDNFEWTSGYTERFGLHFVDFANATRPRAPKMSALVYKNIIKSRKIDWYHTPRGFHSCIW